MTTDAPDVAISRQELYVKCFINIFKIRGKNQPNGLKDGEF